MTGPKFDLIRVVSRHSYENTYLLRLKDRDDCLVVDPGYQPEKILDRLEELHLVPAAILNTHGHSDHIAGNEAVKQRWPDCPLIIGHNDAAKLTNPDLNLSAHYGPAIVSPPADQTVRSGDRVSAAGFDLTVREVPGHSAGHVVFVWEGNAPSLAFVGDIIFLGSVGRTDFFDGDFEQLATGIREQIFSLADDTILLPGHGPATTVGQEKGGNPYVRG